jgi:hypothetical protein
MVLYVVPVQLSVVARVAKVDVSHPLDTCRCAIAINAFDKSL